MKKIGVKHIIGIIVECCALVLIVLCIATDINDNLFLPLALGCVCVGSVIGLYIQIQERKKNKDNTDK